MIWHSTGRPWQLLLGLALFLFPFLVFLPATMPPAADPLRWQGQGLRAGAVDDLAAALDAEGRQWLYAALRGQGVFRRVDGGPWELVNTGLPQGLLGRVSPHRLLADPQDGRRAWVAVFDQTGGAVYATTDGGEQWQPVLQELPSHVRVLQWLPETAEKPTRLVVATTGFVTWSDDGGQRWQEFAAWPGEPEVASLAAAPDGTLYLGVVGDLFRSQDDGKSWVQANAGLGRLTARALLVDPEAPERLYVATSNGVYLSSNSGFTWESLGFGLSGRSARRLLWLPGTSPEHPPELLAGVDDGGVWRYRLDVESGPGNGSWQPLRQGMGAVRINVLALPPDGRTLLAGTDTSLLQHPVPSPQ